MSEVSWQWWEFQQVGTDYDSLAEVRSYDERMRAMRDVDAENRMILSCLNLNGSGRVLEIGTGTGSFARAAAAEGHDVTALDISDTMLAYAREKAAAEGVRVDFRKAGFLSCALPDATLDGIVSGMAFHHLPDLWKAIALRKLAGMLKPGARLVLLDVVFDWSAHGAPEPYFEQLLARQQHSRAELARHIAQEYSTLRWIMRGLLDSAGLEVLDEQRQWDFISIYTAQKK